MWRKALCPTQGTSEHRCGKTEVKIDLLDTGGTDSVTWNPCPLGQLGPFRRGFRGHSPVAKLIVPPRVREWLDVTA